MEGGGWPVGHPCALNVSYGRSDRIREPPSLPVTDNVVQQYDDSNKNAHWSWRSMPPTVSEPSRHHTSSILVRGPPKMQASVSRPMPPHLTAPFTLTAILWEDEGVSCFQVEARGVCVSRREDNHMINGTKLLNVAGLTRGRRDGILKSERTRHVVKIGPTHVKGVWIPLHRALDFANKERITELLYPLFEYNIGPLLHHPLNQPSSQSNAVAPQSPSYSYALTKGESSHRLDAIEHKNKVGAAEGVSYSPWLNKVRNHDAQERQEHSQDQPLVAGPYGPDVKMRDHGRRSVASGSIADNDSRRMQQRLSEPRALDISSDLGMHHEYGRQTKHVSADARLRYSVLSKTDRREDDAAPQTQATSAAELYDIIRDLRTRVSRLFEKTGVALLKSSGGESSDSDSNDDLSVPSSPFPDRATGSSEHSEELSVHYWTRLRRSRSVEHSRTRLGDLHMRVAVRSQSQPPPISRRAVISSHNDGSQVECAPNGRPSLHSFTRSTDGKRGREESAEGRIGGGQEEGRTQGSRAKRPRQCHTSGERGGFPCIFHAGEPGRYPKDTATYEFISQLLRHLRSHDFYACSKCFTKFDDLAGQELHENNPCRKSCPRRRCKRYVPFNASPLSTCECITTASQQWYELFRLEYPGQTFQGLLDRVPPPEPAAVSADPFPLLEQVNTFETLPEDFNMDRSGPNAGVSGEERPVIALAELNPAHGPLASPLVVDPSFFSEIQTLRDRVRHLEQRIAQPTEREQDLEMVLANVWQALARSSSAEGQPRSAVWRLVQRFASNVLSNSPAPSDTMNLGNVSMPVVMTNEVTGWQDLWNDGGPMVEGSKATGMDSAYGSMR